MMQGKGPYPGIADPEADIRDIDTDVCGFSAHQTCPQQHIHRALLRSEWPARFLRQSHSHLPNHCLHLHPSLVPSSPQHLVKDMGVHHVRDGFRLPPGTSRRAQSIPRPNAEFCEMEGTSDDPGSILCIALFAPSNPYTARRSPSPSMMCSDCQMVGLHSSKSWRGT
jgi:hypothetical protein